MKIFDHRSPDGSRQFLALPESASWSALRMHVEALPGAIVTGYLTDHVTEVWIDFRFRGHVFSINTQYGEYWFFVRDPDCPASTLEVLASHCALLLESRDANSSL